MSVMCELPPMEPAVPQFVSRAVPVPPGNRVPGTKALSPRILGIFLWVGFYLKLAGPTLAFARAAPNRRLQSMKANHRILLALAAKPCLRPEFQVA